MTPEQFTYWLQGFIEIHGEVPTEQQWEVIKDHLQLVFDKQTPDRNKLSVTNKKIDLGDVVPHVPSILDSLQNEVDNESSRRYCSR